MKAYNSGIRANLEPKANKIGFGKKPMDSMLSVLKKFEILYLAGHGNINILTDGMGFDPTSNTTITSMDLKKETDNNIEMKTEIVVFAACKSAGGGGAITIGPFDGNYKDVLAYFAKAFRAGETITPSVEANIDKKRIYIGFQTTQGEAAWGFMKKFSECIFRSADWLWCMKEGVAYGMSNDLFTTDKTRNNPNNYQEFYSTTIYDNLNMDFTMLSHVKNNKPCRIPAVVAIGVKRGKSVDDLFKKG